MSYLGWYIFIIKKDIVLYIIRRVVLISFSEKKLQPSELRQIILPPGPFPQKTSFAAAELFRGRRRGGGASADVGRGVAVVEGHFQRRQRCRCCRRCQHFTRRVVSLGLAHLAGLNSCHSARVRVRPLKRRLGMRARVPGGR